MPKSGLTGSRIRSRRLDLGLRQTELARSCGISASYLNLIEHNRRRIGGKLLVDIARTLGIEVSALSQGADRSLIEDLQGAADRIGLPAAGEAMEDLAGRYPDAARLVIEQARRIDELEGALETLSDRLAHDPHLAESLHDVLTTAAAIRSASAILAEEDVDPAWQARFHRNLHEDSRRLADASRALASYLEVGADASRTVLSPQEELHAWLDGMGFRLSWIEEGADEAEDARRIAADDGAGSAAAQALARAHVAQYRRDAARMPEARVREILQEAGPDPARLAAELQRRFPRRVPQAGGAGRRRRASFGRAGRLRRVGRDGLPPPRRRLPAAAVRRSLSALAALRGDGPPGRPDPPDARTGRTPEAALRQLHLCRDAGHGRLRRPASDTVLHARPPGRGLHRCDGGARRRGHMPDLRQDRLRRPT
jgi:transcriptional regulator with XRE-family HTH domain/ribosomal protein S14